MPAPSKVRVTMVWSPTTCEETTIPTLVPSSRLRTNASPSIVTIPPKVSIRLLTIERCASPPLTWNDDTVGAGAAVASTVKARAATLFAARLGLVRGGVGDEEQMIVARGRRARQEDVHRDDVAPAVRQRALRGGRDRRQRRVARRVERRVGREIDGILPARARRRRPGIGDNPGHRDVVSGRGRTGCGGIRDREVDLAPRVGGLDRDPDRAEVVGLVRLDLAVADVGDEEQVILAGLDRRHGDRRVV